MSNPVVIRAFRRLDSFPGSSIVTVLLIIIITLLVEAPALATDGEIHIGNHILREKFRHKSEGYYFPLEETVKQFGMRTEIRDEKIIIHDTSQGDIRIPIDESKFEIDGETIDLGYTPIKRNDIIFFPGSFFADILGLTVHGDGSEEGIFISRKIDISEVSPEGVMIEFPYPLSYTDFELDDGDSIRLVVDFDAALLDGGTHQADSCESFINFRAAQFTRKPDIARVVIEIKKDRGIRPKYSIDRKPNGLWIGLRPNAFDVELNVVEDGCVAEITHARYDKLDSELITDNGETKLVLDFTGARFPEGVETVPGIGPISRVRLADHDGDVRIVFDLLAPVDFSIDEMGLGKVRVTFSGLRGDLIGRVIVIDPGHGGRDSGAVKGHVMEKTLNLEMSLWLADELRSYGATVYLTRTTDIYLYLEERVEYARHHRADLFICIHTNATRQPVTEVHGPLILFDENCENMDLLEIAYEEMVKHGGREGLGPRLDDRGLYLLKNRGDMPILFIEAGFMTNPTDLKLLTQPEGEFKRNLMHGVAIAVLRYYTGNYIPAPFSLDDSYGFDHSLFTLLDEDGLFGD